jgi:hypothetical protein
MYKLPQLVILNAWNVTWVQEYEFHIFKVKIYNTFHYEYFIDRISIVSVNTLHMTKNLIMDIILYLFLRYLWVLNILQVKFIFAINLRIMQFSCRPTNHILCLGWDSSGLIHIKKNLTLDSSHKQASSTFRWVPTFWRNKLPSSSKQHFYLQNVCNMFFQNFDNHKQDYEAS